MKRLSPLCNLLLICLLLLASSCASVHKAAQNTIPSISELRFLSEYDVPHNYSYKGTTVGGLSGIDYDAARNVYYMICDDRSAINAARFYTAKIAISGKGIDSVWFVAVTPLLQPNGTPYPNSAHDPGHTPDPEALRYNPKNDVLVWSSEGERIITPNRAILEDPAVTIINREGKYIDTFPLPANMHIQAIERGPRRNGVFEGLTFADKYGSLYVNVEEPLYEDGPRAGLKDSTAWVRFIKYDVKSKRPVAQYAYQIEPVVYPPNPPDAFRINGVPDILSIGNNQMIVIERSFSTGKEGCVIRVFLANLTGASDISATTSLMAYPAAHPITKRLLLNMDALGRYIDNVEGVTIGPTLPNGHKTLLFVADDNFSKDEKTQFLLFEVLP